MRQGPIGVMSPDGVSAAASGPGSTSITISWSRGLWR